MAQSVTASATGTLMLRQIPRSELRLRDVHRITVALGPHGIRCLDLAPDVTQTPQLPYDKWLDDSDREKVPLWVPVGRLGSPTHFGMLAAFLASDHAGFVTGVSIPVDGGTLAAGGWYRSNRPGRTWTNRPYEP